MKKLFYVLFFAFLGIQSCKKSEEVTDNELGEETAIEENATTSENAPFVGAISRYEVDSTSIVNRVDFKVSGILEEYQNQTEKHLEIWDLVNKIVPPLYMPKLSHLMIFAGENTRSYAFVNYTERDLSKWQLAINIDRAYEHGFNSSGFLAYTIIHELTHVFTLEKLQVDSAVLRADCSRYFPGEGCAKEKSYLDKFHKQFWADIAAEHATAGANQDARDEFYTKYEDRFVTRYAATNAVEDIAEVFTTFVTRNGGANGNSIAEQKIQFMYDYSQLVALRDYIREKDGITVKSKSFLPKPGSWENANIFGDPKNPKCWLHQK